MSESSDKELSDFAMSNFEKQLKSLAPRESAVHRDDLLFRAGYEAGVASVNQVAAKVDETSSVVGAIQKLRVAGVERSEPPVTEFPFWGVAEAPTQPPSAKTHLSPWMQSVAVAVLVLVGAICGVAGWQIGERQTVARYEALPNLMNQLTTTSPRVIKPNKGGANLSIAKSSEPLPPVYATDDDVRGSFASSNEPNYIELRDQVLRFGVDAMPESYSLAIPVKSSKEQKALTPLSYGSVMELSTERH